MVRGSTTIRDISAANEFHRTCIEDSGQLSISPGHVTSITPPAMHLTDLDGWSLRRGAPTPSPISAGKIWPPRFGPRRVSAPSFGLPPPALWPFVEKCTPLRLCFVPFRRFKSPQHPVDIHLRHKNKQLKRSAQSFTYCKQFSSRSGS